MFCALPANLPNLPSGCPSAQWEISPLLRSLPRGVPFSHLPFSKSSTYYLAFTHDVGTLRSSSCLQQALPPPKTSDNDNMRLPAYRASYLGRYHPYPRTRVPAREAVVVCALPRSYSNHGALIVRHPTCSLLQKASPPKRAG